MWHFSNHGTFLRLWLPVQRGYRRGNFVLAFETPAIHVDGKWENGKVFKFVVSIPGRRGRELLSWSISWMWAGSSKCYWRRDRRYRVPAWLPECWQDSLGQILVFQTTLWPRGLQLACRDCGFLSPQTSPRGFHFEAFDCCQDRTYWRRWYV